MGKGKRVKSIRAQQDNVPMEYDHEKYMQEFKDSEYSFAVYRKWVYIKLKVNPNTINSLVERSLMAGVERMGAKVVDGKILFGSI